MPFKRHPANDDLRQRFEAAKNLADGNPNTSAPGEVLGEAKARVEKMEGLVRETERAAAGQIDSPVRQFFKRVLPLSSKDKVLQLKEQLADACEVQREIEEWLRQHPT